MASLVNNAVFVATSGGTGAFGVSSAATGYQTPAAAGAADTKTYRYRAQSSDLTQWEIGTTVASSTATSFTRVVTASSAGGTTTVNFTAAPTVALTMFAADVLQFDDAMSLTSAQQAQARTNIGAVGSVTPNGRLTLQTAVPVMITTQSAKTTLYYTPYVGNSIPIYDGSNMVATAFSELSVATTDTAKSPAAIGASKVNDWFVWDDAGTLRLGHGPDWTSDTVRSAGTALVMVNGILLNNAAITNGPAASRGTYVGTTRSNSSSQLDFIVGAAGIAGWVGVWNAYNRRPISMVVAEGTASWTYTTAAIRASNNSALSRVSFVSGLAEDTVGSSFNSRVDIAASAGYMFQGIALDTTTIATSRDILGGAGAGAGAYTSHNNVFRSAPLLGFHYIASVEQGDGTNANTVSGSSGYFNLAVDVWG